MIPTLQFFDQLIDEALFTPMSHSRLAMFEEAVRIADLHKDIRRGYQARQWLIETANAMGRVEHTFVAFSWCLAQYEKFPNLFHVGTLIDDFTTVLLGVTNFPEVSREQVESLLTQMKEFFQKHGYSIRQCYLLRRALASDLGDRAMAQEAHREAMKHPEDSSCFLGTSLKCWDVYHHHFVGEDIPLIQIAISTLSQKRDAWVEGWMCGYLLLPLIRQGRMPEAEAYHQCGFNGIRTDVGFEWHWAPHVAYLALSGQLEKGVRLFERLLPMLINRIDLMPRFFFYYYAAILFDRLKQVADDPLTLRLDESLSLFDPSQRYTPTRIANWLVETLESDARRIDTRNQNRFYSDFIQNRTQWQNYYQNSMPKG